MAAHRLCGAELLGEGRVTGSITDLSHGRAPSEVTARVCIVGSGSGGAVAAQVLAGAGLDVVVLEEGGDARAALLTQRDVAMHDRLYMDRGNRTTEDMSVNVLQGRVLGGGGVINASDVVPIPDGVLRHWVRRHGLTDFAPEAMAPHRDEVLADLSASRIAEHQLNANNRLLRDGAARLGLRGEVLMHNRRGCRGLGTCLLGCPAQAKRNPRLVAIPRAVADGARVFTRARVVALEHADRAIKRLRVRTLDAQGHRETGEIEVRAEVVVLAANAVNTAHLLLRSGVGNTHVGRHLTLQPQLLVTARFDGPVEAHRGIPQAYAVTEHEVEDHPEHGLWGFRIESIMATPGMFAAGLTAVGPDLADHMQRYTHLAACLLLVPDAPSGQVGGARSSRPVIRYAQRDDHRQRLRHAIRVAARIYLAMGAREVYVPVVPPLHIRSEADLAKVDAIPFGPATAVLVSAHQQGTVRMAPSAKDGAADPEGQVYGARDVYVFDSSGFPTSASSHTMAPIMTVARALATRLSSAL
jgi:choline dehydrogenase-like flavoprotein